MKIKVEFRDFMNISPDVEVWGDSGGYQSSSLGEFIPIEKILNWYERNCNYGFIQDFPGEFLKLEGGDQDWVSFDEFKKSADATAKSNESFAAYKSGGGKCKIYNIQHGRNLDQMEYWYSAVKNDIFDGWSIGTKPTNSYMVSFGLAYMYSKGVRKNVHVFAASGNDVLPLLVWVSNYIDHLTTDSTSYAIGNRFHRYFNPLDIRQKLLIGGGSIEKYKQLPCDCPVCMSVKKIDALYAPTAIAGTMISLHNLFHMNQYVNLLRLLAQNKADFMEYVASSCSDETKVGIEYFEYAVKYGFDKANERYMHLLDSKHNLFENEQERVSFSTPGLGIQEPVAVVSQTVKKQVGEKVERKEEQKEGVLLPIEFCSDWL